MFKEIDPGFGKLALAAACALALSGCSKVVADINAVSGALTSPQTTQAIANLKAGSQAIVCGINSADVVYDNVVTTIKAGKATIQDANTILTVTSDVCTGLGGVPNGTAVVPASAVSP